MGGQYNFVAMAHSLSDARSILCVRSKRGSSKNLLSNIMPHYERITIPRHLRDIVVTEYGIADLRSKTDEEIAIALIQVADSRLQEALLKEMKLKGKVREDYLLPPLYTQNYSAKLTSLLNTWRAKGNFPAFHLGTDFTNQEIALGKSLTDFKSVMSNPKSMLKAVTRSFIHKVDADEAKPFFRSSKSASP